MGRTDGNAFRANEVIERILDELRKMVGQMLVTDVAEVIVVRILRHTPVEVRPRQNVHRVLLVLDCPDRYLREVVIV